MIGSLRGTLCDRADSEATIEVAGVGYRVQLTPRDLIGLGDVGTAVFVWTHHHRREDAETLYGFGSRDDRDVFETLIGTHGVGPALGLAILSVHTPQALRVAVATNDVSALCLVPGVGRKTAARLVLELASRLAIGEVDVRVPATDGDDGRDVVVSAQADVREALTGLGYGADEISVALRELPTDADSSDLLRQALRRLAVR